ncbi:MAG: (2Fe-2S)-binding protein [Gammaproteobacteria bacterium]|nr:(2Fe-2S)-binding protein [Gammaproteobacteria bacterium]
MYICLCHAVTDSTIKKAIDNGASSVQDLKDELNVATCCGRCLNEVNEIMENHMKKQSNNEPVIWLGNAQLFTSASVITS